MLKFALLSLVLLAACKPRSDGGEAGQRIYELRRAHHAVEAAKYCPNHVTLVRSEKFEKDFAEFNSVSKQPGSILRQSYHEFMQKPEFCDKLRKDMFEAPSTFPHLRLT